MGEGIEAVRIVDVALLGCWCTVIDGNDICSETKLVGLEFGYAGQSSLQVHDCKCMHPQVGRRSSLPHLEVSKFVVLIQM